MYNVNSATAAMWNIATGRTSDTTGATSSSFAEMFGLNLQSMQGGGNLNDMLASLAERFPNANIKNITNADASKKPEEVFGKNEGDNIGVTSDALASIFGNSDFAKQIQDALSSFFNSDATSGAMSGAYSQRSVTITITTVHFQYAQRDAQTGDVLASQDLQTELQDKLKDLIDRIFGGKAQATGTDEEESDDSTEAGEKTPEAGAAKKDPVKQGYSNFSAWSMQLFYSNHMLSTMDGSKSASAESFQFSASYMQGFASSFLPEALASQLGQSGSLSGPFTSLLEGSLSQMGITSGGFSQTTDGFLMNLRNGRDFLQELLELTGRGKQPAATEAPAPEEGAEVVDEVPETAAAGA